VPDSEIIKDKIKGLYDLEPIVLSFERESVLKKHGFEAKHANVELRMEIVNFLYSL
jgi:hypothetical protein